jgi:hypothetical protein
MSNYDYIKNPIHRLVFEESDRFRAALPILIKQYRDKWVLFKDGKVQAVFDDEFSAHCAGVQNFGVDGGFVVAQVVEDTGPVPITAGVFFSPES